jgi:ABC-type oligopeptide transport system ATPase subunit
MSRRGGTNNWKWWDVSSVRDDSTIGFFGPRGCGKTTAMRSVLRAKNLNRGIVMCPTPEAFVTYSKFVPSCFIYDEFSEETLEKVMSFQNLQAVKIDEMFEAELAALKDRHNQVRAEKWKQREEMFAERATRQRWSNHEMQLAWLREIEDEKFSNTQDEAAIKKFMDDRRVELRRPSAMFLVLDDLSSYKAAMSSETTQKLINNGRHYIIMLMVAVQYSVDFPCKCRGGLDWLVIFYDSMPSNVKRLYEMYVGIFHSRDQFDEAIDDARRRNAALVVRKNNQSPHLTDSVFLYSPDHLFASNSFLGDKQFAWVHNMFYDAQKANDRLMHFEATKKKGGAGPGKRGRGEEEEAEIPRKPSHARARKDDAPESVDRKEVKQETEVAEEEPIEQMSDEEPEEFEKRRKETLRKRQFDADLRGLRARMKAKAARKQTIAKEKDRAAAITIVEVEPSTEESKEDKPKRSSTTKRTHRSKPPEDSSNAETKTDT